MISCHNHTDRGSNLRLLDCMVKTVDLIKYAIKIGLHGVAITDHESVSSHIEAIQTVKDINKLYHIYKNDVVQESIAQKSNMKDNNILKGISDLSEISIDDLEKMVKSLPLLEKMVDEFKLILGNEIYLVDDEYALQENYKSGETKFFHFILLAKDAIGHKQLRELSSIAWDNNYWTGQMERTPTRKSDLEAIVQGGHIVASTACLGSEFSQLVLELLALDEKFQQEDVLVTKKKIHKFLAWCINVFGRENFFIEIQPSDLKTTAQELDMAEQEYMNMAEASDDNKAIQKAKANYDRKYNSYQSAVVQAEYNKKAIEIAKAYKLGWIVTTDSHYLAKKDRKIHSAFLNSKDGDRETSDFYATTYVMDEDEIRWHIDYLPEEDIQTAFKNTMLIGSMVENYDLYHPVIVPRIDLPEFELTHLFKRGYEQYPYIEKFAYSDDEQDRYLLKLIEDGFRKKIWANGSAPLSREYFHVILDRINTELSELWEITNEINTKLSSYYITTREIINTMWEEGDSLVGIARGSVTGFLMAYLIDITQINPIQWNLPHWRHLTASRPECPDVDLDSCQSRRKQILEALKRKFGERKVLSICTFGTEGSRSSLLTACRGLGIDNDTAQYLTDYIPYERGSNWSLSDCIYGDEEKGRRPIKEFIFELEKYDQLLETALAIEGLVTKRSVHASGVYIFRDDFLEQNARMKAPNGQHVTQWNMGDSDYCGGLKVDLLTIQALDKIRTCMDLLIKDGYMEWKGSLRETYNAYLHPDVLDYKTAEMWTMIANNEIVDLFQFDTEVGLNSAKKVKPANLFEMAVTNSLMRLMAEHGQEQPVDTYVKYKNDINLWYKEMKDYGLTLAEIEVLKAHLEAVYGVADTQEVVMQLSMNPKISNFDLKKANKLRKGIAKKVGKVQEEAKKMFYEEGNKVGTSTTLLNYVWNVQIARQLGYSFSINHCLPYSGIGLQEMNLAFHYPIIYWNVACLTVNAGADEDNEDNKSTDYGKIATAIGNMQQRGITVALPDINDADFGFKPDIANNQIIFGLKGINGIGDEVVNFILANRPYNSFADFLKKTYQVSNEEGMNLKNNQIIQLIKAGCFDKLENKPREEIMKDFIKIICEPKTQVTLQNLPMLITYDLIPADKYHYVRLSNFKKHLAKNIAEIIPNNNPKVKKAYSDRLLFVEQSIKEKFFDKYFSIECIYRYESNGVLISEKKFTKEYDRHMEEFKKWLSTPEVLNSLNEALFMDTWNQKCAGSISRWEMESLSYYYHDHELLNINTDRYSIVDFNNLPETPEIAGSYYRGEQKRFKFKLDRIVGTVLDKDKHKHIVTLLTPTGVVSIKLYDGAFQHYNKQISADNGDGTKSILEKSWFTRGNLLMVGGFRSGNQFRPYKYVDSIFQHTVTLIEGVDEDGNLDLKLERERTED